MFSERSERQWASEDFTVFRRENRLRLTTQSQVGGREYNIVNSRCLVFLDILKSVLRDLWRPGMGIRLWLQDTAGTVQDKAQGAAGAAQDKTNQAGGFAGEKWEQTKQAASDTTQATQDKAQDAKKATGGFVQQVEH